MREISFEMARDMGLINIKSAAEIGDEILRAGRYDLLEADSIEHQYRKELATARQITTVTLEGEVLKVV